MGRSKNDATVAVENDVSVTTPATSSPGNISFFNQRQSSPPQDIKAPESEPVEKISMETAQILLLAEILKELKIQNTLTRLKMEAKKEKTEEKSQAADKQKEQDDARFEGIRYSMYS
ncbi:MAG: hypothetical protein H0U57_03080 [Tatlockia sp.]|nr:hypothetical protein [Tatlockia sp.]